MAFNHPDLVTVLAVWAAKPGLAEEIVMESGNERLRDPVPRLAGKLLTDANRLFPAALPTRPPDTRDPG